MKITDNPSNDVQEFKSILLHEVTLGLARLRQWGRYEHACCIARFYDGSWKVGRGPQPLLPRNSRDTKAYTEAFGRVISGSIAGAYLESFEEDVPSFEDVDHLLLPSSCSSPLSTLVRKGKIDLVECVEDAIYFVYTEYAAIKYAVEGLSQKYRSDMRQYLLEFHRSPEGFTIGIDPIKYPAMDLWEDYDSEIYETLVSMKGLRALSYN